MLLFLAVGTQKDVTVLIMTCATFVLKFVKVCYMVKNFENFPLAPTITAMTL